MQTRIVVARDRIDGRGQCPPWMHAYRDNPVDAIRVNSLAYRASDGKKYSFTIYFDLSGKRISTFISIVNRANRIIAPPSAICDEIIALAESYRSASA